MSKKIQPLGDRVAVKPIKEEEKSTSGIILPESSTNEKTQLGEVIAVGELKDTVVKVGDTVLFSEYGYDTVEVDGDEYYIMKSEKVLASLK
jgi:chaperonin GroES